MENDFPLMDFAAAEIPSEYNDLIINKEEELNKLERLNLENEQFKFQAMELNEKIEILLEQKKDVEYKNVKLKEQIDELLEQLNNAAHQMDRARDNSTLSEMKIEPKVYIKGMFDHFDFSKNALAVYIDGTEYFYPLKAYQGQYLPMSGSRVLIFKSSSGEALLYGFDLSKLIDPIKKIKAEVKSFLVNKHVLKLRTAEYGFVEVEVVEGFFDMVSLKIGDEIMLNHIMVDGDDYFTFASETAGTSTRDSILKLLL